MSIYQKLKATGKIYTFKASSWDIFDRKDYTPEDGTKVRKTQPYGCPKNGTFGMCYIEDADTGNFIGMVSMNSLEK